VTAQPSFFDPLGRDLVEGRRRLVRRRRTRRIAGAAAVVALAGVGMLVATLDRGPDEREFVAEPAPTLPPSEWSWRPVVGFPSLGGSDPGVTLWFGDRLFLWSGDKATVYDPATGRATDVAPPPVQVPPTGGAAWTGREIIVVGGSGYAASSSGGVAYDPQRDGWRVLPQSPVSWRSPTVIVWTGREVIFWGEEFRSAETTRQGAAYNPETNAWRRLADAPVGLNLGNGVWTGTELIVIGSDLDGNNVAQTPTQMLRYDPDADEWTVGPPPPVSAQSSHAVWNGELVVWDYLLAAVRYDREANEWRPLPPAPLDDVECYVDGTTVGRFAVLAYCGQYAALDLRTETWTVIRDPGESGAAGVAPDHILHFGPSGNELLVTR
jgi:hypothetical protein